ncbi:MAG: redoxin family protein [Halofilum sp. (in: g-proteobacteria)]|nr:redoxin family protein [Halofilum sp. (in: g-proteobacteria)]
MIRRSNLLVATVAAATMVAFALAALSASGRVLDDPRPLPEFTHAAERDWLRSRPLTRADLAGSVTLIDIWAFECWNCYRSFPWLKSLEARFADRDFRVIGVHAPEFEHEKDHDRVAAKMEEFGLDHPVMIDNDFSYWRALGNRYWPTFYIVDRETRIRGVFIGETHEGDRRARAIEALVGRLLEER